MWGRTARARRQRTRRSGGESRLRGQWGRPAGSRLRARAESAVVSIPRPRRGGRLELSRLVPSGRSVLLGLALLAAARPRLLRGRLDQRLRSSLGRRLGRRPVARPRRSRGARRARGPEPRRRSTSPTSSAASRRCLRLPRPRRPLLPARARVTVVPERPVAVFARGGLMARLGPRARDGAVGRGARPCRGSGSGAAHGSTGRGARRRRSARVRSRSRRLPARGFARASPRSRATDDELTLCSRSGLELRLGDASELPLKLAVPGGSSARGATRGYVDVACRSGPSPGATLKSKVEAQTSSHLGRIDRARDGRTVDAETSSEA